jgi:hypothetical protein
LRRSVEGTTYSGQQSLFKYGWVDRFKELIARNSGLGFEADLGDMEIEDLHGLYLRLNRDCKNVSQ